MNTVPQFEGQTTKELADLLNVSPATVRSWIKQGKLTAVREHGKLVVLSGESSNVSFILEQIKKKHHRENKPYVSEKIKGYAAWHAVLDEFTWLLKVSYSPAEDVKKKRFRADQLFANYIRDNNIFLKKIKGEFSVISSPNKKNITDDLKRGWYNETAYLFPLKRSTLGHSFRDITINMDISEIRFSFPSWKIISAYYAVYFYLRSVTLHIFDGFRLEEHNSTIKSFKYNALSRLSRTVWKFPFDITYDPQKKLYRSSLRISHLRHTKFSYSSYPREPYPLPLELFENIFLTFKKRGGAHKKATIYTIFDYLRDFRTWANYLDIDNLLSLRGTGYKAFLDQNLSLILFFIGGISELCYIAVFGENVYIKQLQDFYDEFVTNSPALVDDFLHTSIYQRLIIYNKLGFVKEIITLMSKPDINAVSI